MSVTIFRGIRILTKVGFLSVVKLGKFICTGTVVQQKLVSGRKYFKYKMTKKKKPNC